MSEPISDCMIFAAARGNEESYQELLAAMRDNLDWGGFTQTSCSCQPPCPKATEEQVESLNQRLQADLYRNGEDLGPGFG